MLLGYSVLVARISFLLLYVPNLTQLHSKPLSLKLCLLEACPYSDNDRFQRYMSLSMIQTIYKLAVSLLINYCSLFYCTISIIYVLYIAIIKSSQGPTLT